MMLTGKILHFTKPCEGIEPGYYKITAMTLADPFEYVLIKLPLNKPPPEGKPKEFYIDADRVENRIKFKLSILVKRNARIDDDGILRLN